MDTNFNSYREWLGLDNPTTNPSYYEMLGLDPSEQRSQKISEAADRAIAKVRSCRPGPHAAQWAKLLDELKEAKSCLLDASQRQQYDSDQSQPGSIARAPAAKSNKQPAANPSAGGGSSYPPGMAGASPQSSSSPVAAPVSARTPVSATQKATAPTSAAATPAAAAGSPASLPSPQMPGQSPAPTSYGGPLAAVPATPLTAAPNPLDPMAPVALSGTSAQPLAHSTAPVAAPTAADPMAPFQAGVASAVPTQYPSQPVAAASTTSAEAGAGVRIGGAQSNTSKASQRIKRSNNSLIMLGVGAVMFVLCAGIVYWIASRSMNGKEGEQSEQVAERKEPDGNSGVKNPKRDVGEPVTPNPAPNPTPAPIPPEPAPNPAPMPVPPEPTPDPAPTPLPPEPAPDPTPAPLPMPAPQPMPTPQELAALSQAMTAARAALADKNPEAALSEVAKAEEIAVLDEHKAMVSRLRKVAGLVQEFWAAVDKARTELTGLDEIVLPTGNIIVVVESSPELLIVKINGQSRRFARRQESTKFATVIADRVLPREDPHSLIVKGAAFVVEENEEWRGDGVQMWKDATGFNDEGTELLKFLDDDYDFGVE